MSSVIIIVQCLLFILYLRILTFLISKCNDCFKIHCQR